MIKLKVHSPFNVQISNGTSSVVVTDAHTANQKESRRLPSDTLVSVIQNILAQTYIEYCITTSVQDFVYQNKTTETNVELLNYENEPIVTLTIDDGKLWESYSIDLCVVEGTDDELENIFKQEDLK